MLTRVDGLKILQCTLIVALVGRTGLHLGRSAVIASLEEGPPTGSVETEGGESPGSLLSTLAGGLVVEEVGIQAGAELTVCGYAI
jgi:hypothetical protein